ncbi:MAG TPA: type II toxin-antitoxin system PrlF family antitoxin [Candidimonas sp.]|nr:type II toxin-antitoxin system PrlF family antitoxin [Candidimonas sp.]
MADATMTSKGQVTIPADIRRSLGLSAQDRVTFTPMPDGTVVLRAKTKSINELRGMLKPAAGTTVTVDEMSMGTA